MRTNKSSKADLESKRFIFKEIGVILALGLVLWAYGIKSYEKQEIDNPLKTMDDTPEEMVAITQHNKSPLLPNPPPLTAIFKSADKMYTSIKISHK